MDGAEVEEEEEAEAMDEVEVEEWKEAEVKEEKKEVDEVEMEEEEVETVVIRDISWCPPPLPTTTTDWLMRLSVNSQSSTQRCHSVGAWLGSRGGVISQGAGPGGEEQAQQQR